MRRVPILLVASTMALAPLTTFAQDSFLGSIIPQTGTCTCPNSAPDWGCILQVVQNAINVAVGIGVIVVILAIVYAGFIFMTSGANPSARTQGRNLIVNAVVGLLVILGAWLGVDFVMKAVYNPKTTFEGGGSLGPWNSIWSATGEDMCLEPSKQQAITTGVVIDLATGRQLIGPRTPLGVAGAVCPESKPDCTPQTIMKQGVTEAQANALSCIAMTESTGVPTAVNPKSLACGLFQITNKTSIGNWRQPENHGPGCSTSTSCTNAACNLQTAVIMFKRSGYQPWTCSGCNNKAAACVAKYDPAAYR